MAYAKAREVSRDAQPQGPCAKRSGPEGCAARLTRAQKPSAREAHRPILSRLTRTSSSMRLHITSQSMNTSSLAMR